MSLVNVEVTTRGAVAPGAAELASEKLAELESAVGRPLGGARVVLLEEQNRRIPQSSRAEGEVWLDGKPIRGRVAAESMAQAVNDLAERLQQQLRRHVDRLIARKRRPAEVAEGEWHRAAWTPPRPPRSWRAPGERVVIRRKTFALEPVDAAGAAAEMSALDHDFYLFHDAETDADSVIYRRDDGRLAVIAPQDASGPAGSGQDDVVRERSRYSGPLALDDAVSKMDALNHRFLFFIDAASGRGAVLYLRYDGHYGLIEPAT
jgi:ribosome-associated translation inhibitor RaiA